MIGQGVDPDAPQKMLPPNALKKMLPKTKYSTEKNALHRNAPEKKYFPKKCSPEVDDR